jgi:hypothetical protein
VVPARAAREIDPPRRMRRTTRATRSQPADRTPRRSRTAHALLLLQRRGGSSYYHRARVVKSAERAQVQWLPILGTLLPPFCE